MYAAETVIELLVLKFGYSLPVCVAVTLPTVNDVGVIGAYAAHEAQLPLFVTVRFPHEASTDPGKP